MPSTFRQDVTARLVVILDAFIVANPTYMRRSERARPPSIVGDMPVGFVDNRPEIISHDVGLRDRVMSPSVLVVSPIGDNVETVVSHDQLVDLLVDHFTDYPYVASASSGVWDEMTVSDEDYPVDTDTGTRHFYATRFTFQNVRIKEGRD
jgi:hypothetical protein